MSNTPDPDKTLADLKVAVVMDGDLALSLLNILAFCHDHDFIEELSTCEHVHPKIDELMDRLEERLGIEKEEE